MKSEALARELRAIVARGGGFGTETELALKQLAEALELQPDALVQDLLAKLKPKARRAAASKSTTFDAPAEGVVAEYVDQLKASRNAQEGLVIVAELSKAGRKAPANITQVKEIAGRFLGAKMKFANKTVALDAIKERLERRDSDAAVIQSIANRANP